MQFAHEKVEINIHLLERGVSKKSVTMFSNNHRCITWSGLTQWTQWTVPNVFLGLFPLAGAPQEFSKEAAVTHTSSGSMGAQNPHPGSLSSETSLSTSAYLQTNDVFLKITGGKEKQLIHMVLCILAWKIPWAEEPGRLQSMGPQSQTRLSE